PRSPPHPPMGVSASEPQSPSPKLLLTSSAAGRRSRKSWMRWHEAWPLLESKTPRKCRGGFRFPRPNESGFPSASLPPFLHYLGRSAHVKRFGIEFAPNLQIGSSCNVARAFDGLDE